MKICVINNFEKECWVELPINLVELKEELGEDIEIGLYRIKAYELPFDVSEDISLFKLNKYYEVVTEMNVKIPTLNQELRGIINKWFEDIEDFIQNKDKIIYCSGEEMEAIFKHLIEKYEYDLNQAKSYLITKNGIYYYKD